MIQDNAWRALQHPVFRAMWCASAAYFVGNAMHAMAVSWLMVKLTTSPLLPALVQTVVFLPMCVLALPAGVLADTSDRGRLMVTALMVQAIAIALLLGLLVMNRVAPAGLLLLTLVAGCCTALLTPAWNTMVAEILPRDCLPQSVVCMSMAYNLARALGPTLAGLLFGGLLGLHAESDQASLDELSPLDSQGVEAAAKSGAAVLAFTLAGILLLAWAVRRWPPRPHSASSLPTERLWSGSLAGLRYALHEPILFAQLVRTTAYAGAGSALWALLPAIASRSSSDGALGFGVMMGCMGLGALMAGPFVSVLRARFGLERLTAAGSAVFAAAMLVVGQFGHALTLYAALIAAGGSWMAVISSFNVATQTGAPPWVRSRATALHVLAALGAFALGSALWGWIASLASLRASLLTAAVMLMGSLLLAKRFRLRAVAPSELAPAPPEPLFIVAAPDPGAGPVAVEISYYLREGATEQFLALARSLEGPRRRGGASGWRLYRDLGDEHRYVERFQVPSWADYLRQQERRTLADKELYTLIGCFLRGNSPTSIRQYLVAR